MYDDDPIMRTIRALSAELKQLAAHAAAHHQNGLRIALRALSAILVQYQSPSPHYPELVQNWVVCVVHYAQARGWEAGNSVCKTIAVLRERIEDEKARVPPARRECLSRARSALADLDREYRRANPRYDRLAGAWIRFVAHYLGGMGY